jgi:hypothetical protein
MSQTFSRYSRLLNLLTLVAPLLVASFAVHGQQVRQLPDASDVLRRMIKHAHAVASAESGSHYAYQSRSILEQLDGSGEVIDSQEKIYTVQLIAGYPIHRLTKIEGQKLSQEELDKEREKELQLRQRFSSLNMEDLAARKESWLTTNLLNRYEFKVTNRITYSNRSTLVITFSPKSGDLPVDGRQDRFLNLLTGTIWLDEEDADAVKVSIGLKETLSMGWFGLLGSLSKCDLTIERTRLPGGIWANTKQTFQIQLRKLAATKRFRMIERSSGFTKVMAEPAPLSGNAKSD